MVEAAILTIMAVALVLTAGLCVFISVRVAQGVSPSPQAEAAVGRLDLSMRDEFFRSREESGKDAKSLREEIAASFGVLAQNLRQALGDLAAGQRAQLDGLATRLEDTSADAARDGKEHREEVRGVLKESAALAATRIGELTAQQGEKLDSVASQITQLIDGNERRQETLRANVELRLDDLRADAGRSARDLRDEVASSLKAAGEGLTQAIDQISRSQKERLDALSQAIAQLAQQTADKQETLRQTVEGRLDAIRQENAEKLEQMRVTVDEKLQSTLEQRLGASFKQVSDSLEQVYRSVGEMHALAVSVGDLKKVLTNVKSRGTWGEVALGNLLEQMMAPEQYGRNVEIQPGTQQRVEFAIRLPGDEETPVWLPIDAKFPTADYELLVDAAERGDQEAVETALRAIEGRIRAAARDICAKYVHPPHSTDFAVLFLPTEGLFAEVIRRSGLIDELQRECHVMVAGPTTLASLLTSLRMGFRSLAIQKRSSEVWKVLGAVKHEFSQFGSQLDRVSRKLDEAQKVITEDVGRRRRAMDRQLRAVESLPEKEAAALLGLDTFGRAGLADGSELEAAE